MSDILVKLLLATDNYEKNLKGAKESTKGFEEAISFAKTSFLKFVAVIGAATSAKEFFTNLINSTQTTGDAFVKAQDQMKASVESFYAALAMGRGFDGFLSNLENVIDRAGDLSTILDNLETKTLFNSAEYSELNTKYQLELNYAKQRNISDAERNKHLTTAKGYLTQIVNLQKSLEDANTQASYAQLNSAMAKQGYQYKVSNVGWDYLLKDTNRAKVESAASRYDANIKKYDAAIVGTQVFNADINRNVDTAETARLRDAKRKYLTSSGGKWEQAAKMFIELADDVESDVAKALQMREKADMLKVDISGKGLEIANTDAKINGGFEKKTGVKTGVKKAEIFAPDSSGDIEKRIKDLQKKIEHATSDGARFGFQKAIDDLQLILDRRTFAAKMTAMPDKNFFMDYQKLPQLRPASLDSALNEKIEPVIQPKDVTNLNSYNSALSTMQNMLVSISNATNSGAAGWLTYGANALQALSNTYLALAKVIPALQVKAVSEGASQQAAAGPLGWVAAIASIGAMLAAFATLPKYATGGFVTGGLTTGDQTLIRANAGELILNAAQQRNIAAQLNNKGQNVKVEVEGRVSGRDLEFVMTKRQRYLER